MLKGPLFYRFVLRKGSKMKQKEWNEWKGLGEARSMEVECSASAENPCLNFPRYTSLT